VRSFDALSPTAVNADVGCDAVIVVPGIMGTELVDTASGRVLWGMPQALGYAARWRHRGGLAALHVTDEERAGRSTRIRPGRLLRVAEWAPVLGGVEPYTDLVRDLRKNVAHPDAVREFGYDWRLSVDHNARLLAGAIEEHLAMWRSHPGNPGGAGARVVLVAHSMGGLVCRALGAVAEVRATVTLGTPFHGAVKAAMILNSGRGAPVPLHRGLLRALAATLPGLHDLLPTYRCVETDDDVVHLTAADVAALGGDRELAEEAFARRARHEALALPGHRSVTGVAQPTEQTMRLRDGVVEAQRYGFRRHEDGELVRDRIGRPVRVDRAGDGTVYRYASHLPGIPEIAVAQQHGALARTGCVIDIVRAVVTGVGRLDTVLGAGDVGLDVPDEWTAGSPLPIRVTGEPDPNRVACTVESPEDEPVARPDLYPAPDGTLTGDVALPPGLFRIRVGAGRDPVTQLVLVTD
jgi:hypothetical protein